MSMHPQPCEYIDIEVEDREDAIAVLQKLTNLKGVSNFVRHSSFEDEMGYFTFENGEKRWVVDLQLDPSLCRDESGQKTNHPAIILYHRHACQGDFRAFNTSITERLLKATMDVLPNRNVQSYVSTMWL